MRIRIWLLIVLIAFGATVRAEDARDLSARMDGLSAEVEAEGWRDSFADDVDAPGESATLFLLDAGGTILKRTNDAHLAERESARVLLSRYRHDYTVNGVIVSCGVALIIDEQGEVIDAYRAVCSPDPVGEDDEDYASFFPDIGEEKYARGQRYYDELGGLTGDLWHYLEKEIVLGKLERLAVVDYINWEREVLELNECASLVYRPLTDSRALVLIVE